VAGFLFWVMNGRDLAALLHLRRFLFSRHGSLRKRCSHQCGTEQGEAGNSQSKKSDADRLILVLGEVTNVGSDRSQLARMAQEAKVALKTEKLDAVADRGYFNGEEILACGRASARTSVRPIDVLNALSGFCSCAAAQSRPARFSR
jgi:hypothetical protein